MQELVAEARSHCPSIGQATHHSKFRGKQPRPVTVLADMSTWSNSQLPALPVTEAGYDMVVDQARRLHVGVNDGAANELEPA